MAHLPLFDPPPIVNPRAPLPGACPLCHRDPPFEVINDGMCEGCASRSIYATVPNLAAAEKSGEIIEYRSKAAHVRLILCEIAPQEWRYKHDLEYFCGNQSGSFGGGYQHYATRAECLRAAVERALSHFRNPDQFDSCVVPRQRAEAPIVRRWLCSLLGEDGHALFAETESSQKHPAAPILDATTDEEPETEPDDYEMDDEEQD